MNQHQLQYKNKKYIKIKSRQLYEDTDMLSHQNKVTQVK